jgi:hypothetical protein
MRLTGPSTNQAEFSQIPLGESCRLDFESHLRNFVLLWALRSWCFTSSRCNFRARPLRMASEAMAVQIRRSKYIDLATKKAHHC